MRAATPSRGKRFVPQYICPALLSIILGTALSAEDLPGIPVPGRIDTPEWELDAGDADIGPSGGGSGDDYRVGHANLDWDHRWISAALDFSLLTSQDPSESPVYWGLPNPFVFAHAGSGRTDEITGSVAFRKSYVGRGWDGWAQIGPGLQLSGDFGGKSLQNAFHTVIGNAPNDLPYVHPGILAAGFVHAGAGASVSITGPVSLDARAIGMLTTGGWTRWRTEGLVVAAGDGGGVWAGLRQDGADGHALTSIADAVSKHESGLGVVVGWSWHADDVQLSLETSHTFNDDGQDGYFSLAYAPEPAHRPLPPGDEHHDWHARVGLSGYDSRVPGHGTDWEMGTGLSCLPRWLEVVIGVREQDMSVPYLDNFSGQRLMVWSGLAADPTLLGGRSAAITGYLEAGAGVRDDRVQSRGFADVDGGDSTTFTTPILRAAAGLGGNISAGAMRYGVLLLAEATAAERRDTELAVHDSFNPSIDTERDDIHLDGDSVGLVLALTWSWKT